MLALAGSQAAGHPACCPPLPRLGLPLGHPLHPALHLQVSPAPEYKVGLTQRPAGLLSGGPPRPAALITPRSITPRSGVRMRPRRSMSATRMSKSPADFLAAAANVAGTPGSAVPGAGALEVWRAAARAARVLSGTWPTPATASGPWSSTPHASELDYPFPACRRPQQRHAQRQHLCAPGEPSPPVCARPAALHRGSWHRQRQPGGRPGWHAWPPAAAHARQRLRAAHHARAARRRRRGRGGGRQRQRRLCAGW